jgi:hypothetical protein
VRPLQWIGLGLVLVVLSASAGDPGYDLVPDPVGWLLVLLGVRRLPERIGHRPLLQGLAAVAGVVSAVLWVPSLASRAFGLEESLRWVLDLPTPGFVLVLGLALGAAAGQGQDAPARAWWRVVTVGALATALLPPVVYGARADGLAPLAVAVAVGTLVASVVLCFAHAARPWVVGVVAADPAPSGG